MQAETSSPGTAAERTHGGAAPEGPSPIHRDLSEKENSRASPVLGTVVLLAVVGLAIFTFQRITDAKAKQTALAAERARTDARNKAAMQEGTQGRVAEGSTVRPEVASWQPRLRLEGTLGVSQEADVGFMASGRLSSVRVKVGEVVKRGQVLGTLDAQQVDAQKAAAEAQVRAAEAQLGLATDGVNRTQPLVKEGAMPRSAAIQAEGQQRLAMAQLDAARAQVQLMTVLQENHVVTSPINGVVTRAPSTPGAVVGPGVPLFHVVDPGNLKFTGTMSPQDAALLTLGSPVELFVQDRILAGTVAAVLPTVDPVTRRVPVEINATNDKQAPIFAGGLVKATARSTADVPVLKLPASTLRPGSQDEVMVVVDGKLVPRRVQFTTAPDGSLLVRSGLEQTDQVFLNPSSEARAGDAVQAPKVSP